MRTQSFWQCGASLAAIALLASCQQMTTLPSTSSPSSIRTDLDEPVRIVEHAMGSASVPIAPQRVVVLDYAPLDTALALGILPVGRIEVTTSSIYPQEVEAMEIVGNIAQPNLEAIFQLQPDLILSDKVNSGRLYRQLSMIAPTVLTQDNGRKGAWKENLRLHAEALGQGDRAQQLLADYDQRVAELQNSLPDPDQSTVVSVIAHWSGGIVAYSADSFSGSVLQDLGFTRNPVQGKGQRYGVLLSRENLSEIDGDIIFLLHNSTAQDSVAKSAFINDPIWSQLDAVKRGSVCEVDSVTWAGGRSILAATQILTDIETCLR
ncbi:MAG: iron-siderophore ABC transporter substrate-binding protein [Cyanothece sp. SIO2G6]|nr:iron-siderophore ABC transporter substrate-binding protein [Cyanothece sp. SIO2G6]